MKNKLIYPVVLMVVFAVACGGDEGRKSASQAAYETVQEGSASGVTSTIHGPGETLPPITGTNADTTTAFTLDPNAVPPAGGTPATIAGTLPSSAPVYGGAPSGGYSSPQPAPRSTTYSSSSSSSSSSSQQQRQVYSPPPQQSQPAPRPMQQQQSEPMQERAEPVESGPTDTATSQPQQTNTNTAPPPQAQPQQQSEPAPATDEGGDEEAAEEPPPPPPPAR